MNVVTRGIRNAFRNGVRTFSIITILGISIGLSLSMIITRTAVEDKITSVKSSIGNTITINPAGMRGFEGGGEPLTTDQISEISSVANVTDVVSKLSDRLTSDNTDLESAIEAGSLGQRFSDNSGTNFQPINDRPMSNDGVERTFTPPVSITGIDDLSLASVAYGSGTISYVDGEAFDPMSSENVAVVGKSLAIANELSIGSTFTAYDTEITVVGIFDTGTEFSNNVVLMPLATLQQLSEQEDSITAVTAVVNSIDNLDSTTEAIKTQLGDAADVTSSQDVAESTVQPLENVKTVALYSTITSLVAGTVIILLTMVMIVRERRREIGVMKAIGSSNAKTVVQFMVESLTLTVAGMVVGLLITFAASAPITNALVQNSTTTTNNSQTVNSGPRGFGRNLQATMDSSVKTIETSVGWATIFEGAAVAILIAVIGSAVPAYFISRVRPSEVMRTE